MVPIPHLPFPFDLDAPILVNHDFYHAQIVGVILAIASGVLIGSSFVFKKKGLLRAQAGGVAGEGVGYLKSPLWWLGMISASYLTLPDIELISTLFATFFAYFPSAVLFFLQRTTYRASRAGRLILGWLIPNERKWSNGTVFILAGDSDDIGRAM